MLAKAENVIIANKKILYHENEGNPEFSHWRLSRISDLCIIDFVLTSTAFAVKVSNGVLP